MSVVVATDQDFNQLLADNPRIIVKYFAGWCGACRLFAPKYRRMADEEGYGNVVFLDVDAESSPEARKLAGVDNLPFFAIFKDGKLVEGDFTAKEESVRKMIENNLLS